jgi:acyl-CoA synthetase (AMP-forming)/AMP-acid ligase II
MYLTQSLHRSLQQHPDQLATIFADRRRTFGEHVSRVARVAGALRSLGVADGERVGILALNSDRYVELLAAVPWANGILNPLNIRWSSAEIGYALTDSGTTILCADDEFTGLLPAIREGQPQLRAVVHLGDGPAPSGTLGYEDLIDTADPVPDARRGDDAVAGLFYTGGTTGVPRGVMLSSANIVTSALGAQSAYPLFARGGRTLHAAPLFHIAAFAVWAAQSIMGGSHVVVPRFGEEAVMTAIEEHAVTSVLLVPTMIQMLLDHPAVGSHDLSSLRVLLYGGSPVTESVLHHAAGAFPAAQLVQSYGMTELAPVATVLTPDDHRDARRLRSAGRAAAHSEIRIVDAGGNEAGPGVAGEILVRGGHVMRGYWNRPEETAQALRGGWMHTGDAGYLDADGYLFVVDRLKDMIISGGENVYSAEVENALGQHPAVAAAAVVGVPDPAWGERVHAVIVRRDGAAVTAAEIRAHVRSLIAGYKAPRSVEFVDALPLSGAGKVVKRALRERYRKDDHHA